GVKRTSQTAPDRRADNQIKKCKETALALVALMTRDMMTRCGIMYRMRRRRAISRGNALRASQVQRRLAGYLGAETKTNAAVTASFVRHRAQRVALGMIAGSAAWTASHSRSGNSDNTHDFILAVRSAATRSPVSKFKLELLTLCSKSATYCQWHFHTTS